VATQLVFLIGTARLRPGTLLPSVRALAHRLGIHRNTISRAYHDAVLNKLVEKRAGRRLAVRDPQPDSIQGSADLDDLLDVAIREARRRGYSMRQLHDRLQQRMAATPADRLLVLSDDAGMRRLLPKELKERFPYRVQACTPGELLSSPERGVGALVISPQGHIPRVRPVLPRDRPAIPITYSSGDAHLESIRRLTAPSVIAVVSVSPYFLEMACGLLATAVGPQHSMDGYLMKGTRAIWPRAADVVVCDVITYPLVCARQRTGTKFVYKLISDDCADTIAAAMER
jgi:DNA-binding transcriptional regulator YhcF (GntR family)